MPKRILLVDDDESTLRFLSVLCMEHDYEAITAANGKEGLEKLKTETVDLIVLDVMMPEKTGFTVFKHLKRDDKLKNIPVIMLTGVAASLADLDSVSDDTHERPYDSLREKLRAAIAKMREEGEVRPDMFMDKPVDPDKFIAKIRDLVGE